MLRRFQVDRIHRRQESARSGWRPTTLANLHFLLKATPCGSMSTITQLESVKSTNSKFLNEIAGPFELVSRPKNADLEVSWKQIARQPDPYGLERESLTHAPPL